jgi:hypothetical protein
MGQEEGKETIMEFSSEMQDKEDVPTQSQKGAKLGLGMASILPSKI